MYIKTFFESKRDYSDIDNIKKYCFDMYKDEYTILSNSSKDGKSKIDIKHNKCGNIWSPAAASFIGNRRRCPFCYGTKKQTIDDLITRCYNLHKDEYQILNTDNYKNNKSKILVKHNCEHEYNVIVQNFFNHKTSCPKCSGKLKLSKEEVVKRCYDIFGKDYTPIISSDLKNVYKLIQFRF
jgi:hypothetical protein